MLNERIENLARQSQEMEGRNQSLQLTVDRLSLTLAKTEEEESAQKVSRSPHLSTSLYQSAVSIDLC